MLTALLLALPFVQAQDQATQLSPGDRELALELRTLADEFHQLGMFQGTVLVARGDTVLLRMAYGYADVEQSIPNVPSTRFRLASVTKQWTAAAVLQLVENGAFELDTPLGDLVQGLSPEIGAVTIHELLSHSGGVIRDLEQFSPKGFGDEFAMPEMIDIVGSTEPTFTPGSSWAYSNAGYVMLSAAIESATGKGYGDAMRELCFEPYGLADTGHEVTGPLLMNRARGYQALPDGYANAPFENKSYVTGAGSLYSSVDDLHTWTRALLNGEVVTPATRDAMFSVQAGSYGYGWFIGDEGGGFARIEGAEARGLVVHHDGGCPGFGTKVVLYPEHDVVVIALSNARPSNPSVLAAALADMTIGLPVNRPSVTADDDICRLAIRVGIEAARERWDALTASGVGPDVMPTTGAVSRRGYRYLDSMQPRKALALFELVAELRPDAASSWFDLGEAHRALGERETAIELYRMAVTLDPLSVDAKQRLAALGAGD